MIYEVGDMPPEGYIQWHGWADAQEKGGLKQARCGECGLWNYPQELTDQQRATHGVTANGKEAVIFHRVCKKCAAKSLIEDTREPLETEYDGCSICWGNKYVDVNERLEDCPHCHGTGIEPSHRTVRVPNERGDGTRDDE